MRQRAAPTKSSMKLIDFFWRMAGLLSLSFSFFINHQQPPTQSNQKSLICLIGLVDWWMLIEEWRKKRAAPSAIDECWFWFVLWLVGYGRCSANGSAKRRKPNQKPTMKSMKEESKVCEWNGGQQRQASWVDGMKWNQSTWRQLGRNETPRKGAHSAASRMAHAEFVEINWRMKLMKQMER